MYLQIGMIASATSFYFTYDFCLGPKTDPRLVYFIKYLPFLVGLATVAILVILSR